MYRFPGMHSQVMSTNWHGAKEWWPRVYDQQLPSQIHLYPFIAPWDLTQYLVLYDYQCPWRSYCIQGLSDPWCNNVDWYTKMDGTGPQFLPEVHKFQVGDMLRSCSKVFNNVVKMLGWASISLEMPDNSLFPLMKDWEHFRGVRSIVEPQCEIKHLVVHAADLRAWAVLAVFKYIDSLAAAHGLPLPHYHVDHQQSGCTLYMSSARLDPKGLFGNWLEEMVWHSTPVYIIKGCP